MVEFVNTFGRLWETAPISLSDLQQALQRPQDHPQLGELYHVLLSCVLLDQVTSSVLYYTLPKTRSMPSVMYSQRCP